MEDRADKEGHDKKKITAMIKRQKRQDKKGPGAKPHLREIFRTDPDLKTREGFIRLDMNESVSGLPLWFVKEAANELNPDLLARYPEYRSLVTKIASHNALAQENICIANGSDAAIKYIFDAYISPSEKVLLTDPTF